MAESLARRAEWFPGWRFGEWLDWLDWPSLSPFTEGSRMLRIEEIREDDTLVIRAEIPGIDPEKDVDIQVRDHVLEIKAQRREETSEEKKGMRRSEFRYGAFYRAVRLPDEAKEGDVQATYKDGILEIRVPCAPPPVESPRRIEVTRG